MQVIKAVNHEKINDITFEKGIVFGVITIDTPQEKFNIALDTASASSINNTIHEVLDNLKSTSTLESMPQPTASTSTADEILKFKELLDSGILTQEEFEAKKKQLLGL